MNGIAFSHSLSHRVKGTLELLGVKTDEIASYFSRHPRLSL